MNTRQISRAISQEIWQMRDNEEAMQKMLDAARLIRFMYVTPHAFENFEREQKNVREEEAEKKFRSLRGCWSDDIEDADRMEKAIMESRRSDMIREINLDD